MRSKALLLHIILVSVISISACSNEKNNNTDVEEWISTVKVIKKNKEENEKEANYSIRVVTILENQKKELSINVPNKNVWNLIEKNQFYRVNFLEDKKILKEIKNIQVDATEFNKKLDSLN